jgi:hypothetical protein
MKELAAELRMSPKLIQWAYRKEETPCSGWAAWLGSISRKFDGRWNGMDEAACVVSPTTRHRRARLPASAGGAQRRKSPGR